MTKEQVDALKEAIKAEVGVIGSKLSQSVEKQEAEIKAFGESTRATAAEIEAHDKLLKKLSEEYEGAQKQLKELEVKLERGDVFGKDGQGATRIKSFGEMFVESGEPERMFSEGLQQTKSVSVGALDPVGEEAKGAVGLTRYFEDGTTRIVPPTRYMTLGILEEPLRIRDLLRVVRTNNDMLEYVELTGYANMKTVLTVAASTGATTITVENPHGFHIGQRLRIITTEGNEAAVVDEVNYATGVVTLAAALVGSAVVGAAVTSMTLAAHLETDPKPQMDLYPPRLVQAAVKTLAHWIPVPRQMLRDLPRLRNEIDTNLIDGLRRAEEYHLLYGDGGDRMLQGVLTHPRRQVYRWSEGKAGDTKIDAVRRALTRAAVSYLPANSVTMHPYDWEDVELQKASDGQYLWVNVQTGGTPQLWRMPISVIQTIEEGRSIVTNWQRIGTLHDRESAQIRVAEQHGDFFIRNMVALLAEQTEVFTIERPEGIIDLLFDNAPGSGS